MSLDAYRIKEFDVLLTESERPVWDTPGSAIDAPVQLAAAKLYASRPGHQIQTGMPAYRGARWQDAYYSRIHISPARIDVGLVQGQVLATFHFWNASETETTITAVRAIGASGVGVSNLPLPITFLPTQEREVVFVISDSGLPVFDALFTFETSRGEVSVRITGMRGVILPDAPDWADPFGVERFHRTVRVASLSTAETRRAMAPRALNRLSYSILTGSSVETARLKRAILQIGERTVGVPLWPEGLRSNAVLESAATLIPTASTVGYRIKAGDLAMIFSAPDNWVLREVESVPADSVVVSQALAKPFPIGAWVVPILTGKLTAKPDFEMLTDEIARVKIQFEEQFL